MQSNDKTDNLKFSRQAMFADAEGIKFYAVIAGAYLLAPVAGYLLTLMGL